MNSHLTQHLVLRTMTADPKTLAVYSERTAEYQEMTGGTQDYRNLDDFIENLPAGGIVYDIGAGPGHDAKIMSDAGLSVVALEPTPEFADLIEHLGIEVQRKTFADINEVAKYDGAWASFSLLHAKRADMPSYLQKIATALKPAGLFVIGMKTGSGERRDKLGRFYCYYTTDELQELLSAAGFVVTRCTEGAARGLAGNKDSYVIIDAVLAST